MKDQTRQLSDWVSGNERWLMRRVLSYAKEHGYTKYTSTLEEAWRQSIMGLSTCLTEALAVRDSIPEMGPDDDFTSDPMAAFGVLEAQRHRTRGVTLTMFLGLMKYYAQSYIDLVQEAGWGPSETQWGKQFVRRFFDRVELGFCAEWTGLDAELRLRELQNQNRRMTNEKNRYLTVFESLASAVLLLDPQCRILNINHAASVLFAISQTPGGNYYDTTTHCDNHLLTWLELELPCFLSSGKIDTMFERMLMTSNGLRHFQIRFKQMLDVSAKFTGITVILSDITKRVEAEQALAEQVARLEKAAAEISTLRGLLPICSYCKRVRDDHNYWNQIETYISAHSSAQFSHGICPQCYEQHIKPQLDTV